MRRLTSLVFATLLVTPLAVGGFATSTHAASVAAGKAVFRQQCSVCHSDKPGVNKIGPSLFGVVGRHIGREPGYDYSVADRNANLVWTQAELNLYINHPQKIVPGTKMPYQGLHNAAKRQDLIAFLATLKNVGPTASNSAPSQASSAVRVAGQRPASVPSKG